LRLGLSDPFFIFNSLLINSEVGGVLVIKSKDLSSYIVITTGVNIPCPSLVLSLN